MSEEQSEWRAYGGRQSKVGKNRKVGGKRERRNEGKKGRMAYTRREAKARPFAPSFFYHISLRKGTLRTGTHAPTHTSPLCPSVTELTTGALFHSSSCCCGIWLRRRPPRPPPGCPRPPPMVGTPRAPLRAPPCPPPAGPPCPCPCWPPSWPCGPPPPSTKGRDVLPPFMTCEFLK